MSIGETTQNIQARAFVTMYQSKTGIILIIMLMTLLKTSLQNLMQLLHQSYRTLSLIINMSFLTGEYPDLLKQVKGGSSQDINNYRLISLLSIFDKIIEKLIHKSYTLSWRIRTYCMKTNLVFEKITQRYML